MPRGISTQVLGGFKTGMDRQTKRGGKDGAQRLYTLENAYLNERGDAVPRPGLQHVANVAHSAGLYGWKGQLHVFNGDTDFVDPVNPLVTSHFVRYPYVVQTLTLTGVYAPATLNQPYSSDLTIAGGSGGYVNPRVVAGSLPDGVSELSIVDDKLRLSGTPTTAATSNFTVAVDSVDIQTATSAQSVIAIARTTMNPADMGTAVTLSDGFLTAGGSGTGTVRSTNPKTSGKYYFECFIKNSLPTATAGVGVASANMNLNDGDGLGVASPSDESLKYRFDGKCVTNSAFQGAAFASYVNGDILMFAVDVGAGKLWAGKNGTWGASGNPSTGTNPKTFVRNGNVYVAVTVSGTSCTFRFSPSDWSYSAPAGFGEWI